MNAYHDGTVPLSDREGEADHHEEPRLDGEDAQAARQTHVLPCCSEDCSCSPVSCNCDCCQDARKAAQKRQDAPGAPAGQPSDSELDEMAEDAARRQEEELVEMLTELVFGLQRLRPGSYWPGDAAINRWLDEAARADLQAKS